MAENDFVLFEKEKATQIATITLNRPDRLNALLPDMRVAIRNAIDDVAQDDDVRVLIITGNGRGFCVGAEMEAIAKDNWRALDEERRSIYLQLHQTPWILQKILALPKPTITALNGVAAGSGICLALIPEIVIASDQARMRVAFTGIGLSAIDGLSYLLPRLFGLKKAFEMIYTNDVIDAEAMERGGLVNRVVAHCDLMKVTRDLACKIAQGPPIGLGLAKRAIYRGLTAQSIEDQLEYEQQIFKACMRTEDYVEGVKAFREKRKPNFRGK